MITKHHFCSFVANLKNKQKKLLRQFWGLSEYLMISCWNFSHFFEWIFTIFAVSRNVAPSQRRCVADDTPKLIVFEREHDALPYLKYKPLPKRSTGGKCRTTTAGRRSCHRKFYSSLYCQKMKNKLRFDVNKCCIEQQTSPLHGG